MKVGWRVARDVGISAILMGCLLWFWISPRSTRLQARAAGHFPADAESWESQKYDVVFRELGGRDAVTMVAARCGTRPQTEWTAELYMTVGSPGAVPQVDRRTVGSADVVASWTDAVKCFSGANCEVSLRCHKAGGGVGGENDAAYHEAVSQGWSIEVLVEARRSEGPFSRSKKASVAINVK